MSTLAAVPGVAAQRPRETTVPTVEFEQVYQAADGRLQLALLLARDAGLRHATIRVITGRNCDFTNRLLAGITKGHAGYRIPMTQRLYERLLFVCSSTKDADEPLFAALSVNRKMPCKYAMGKWLLETKKSLGLKSPWGLHDLRRTAARALYERTHDLRKVQRLLSHSSVIATAWYLGAQGIDLSPADMEE